jgi:hypothetical protein
MKYINWYCRIMSISRDVGNAVLLRPYSFQTIYTSVASSRRNRRDNHNHTECIHSYLLSPFSTSATCLPTGIKYINWYKIQNAQAVTADRQELTTDTIKASASCLPWNGAKSLATNNVLLSIRCWNSAVANLRLCNVFVL